VLDSFGGARRRRSVVLPGTTTLMTLTLADVDHVATLARLGLSQEERERMQEQLSVILDHIGELSTLDTDTIPPTASVTSMTNVWREDEVLPSFSPDEVFTNAPRAADDCFVVQTPLGGESETA
jgi:aspartyl-tRNA(Asn)/glutamyl-tRNA(Gln) amidotransferase subunit C